MVYDIYGPYGLWFARPYGLRVFDATISVDAIILRSQPDAGYGIVFRQEDFDNYYYYRIGADGTYALLIQEVGEFRYLVAPRSLGGILFEGEMHRAAVRLDGDIITLYFDDEPLVEVENHQFPYGMVGVATQALDETPVRVAFDNFLITQP